jgi:HemK-like putative methylase
MWKHNDNGSPLIIPWEKYNQLVTLDELRKGRSVSVLMPDDIKIKLGQAVFVPDGCTYGFINQASLRIASQQSIRNVVEVGVGSGIIMLTLAKHFPERVFSGSDINPKAVTLTQQNIKHNHLKNAKVILNTPDEWLPYKLTEQIDLIISNPPYIGIQELGKPTFRQEYPDFESQPPESMLAADSLGIAPYLGILQDGLRRKVKRWLFRVNSNHRQELIGHIRQMLPEVDIIETSPNVMYLTIH